MNRMELHLKFNSIDTPPEDGRKIIIQYQKGNQTWRGKKGVFLTQGITVSCEYEGNRYITWNDYTNRLLVSGSFYSQGKHWPAKGSKNKIIAWAYLDEYEKDI